MRNIAGQRSAIKHKTDATEIADAMSQVSLFVRPTSFD
jgi:hypothetical protein